MEQYIIGVCLLILVAVASYVVEYLSALPRTHGIAPTSEQKSAAHTKARLKVFSLFATVATIVIGLILAEAFINT